MMPNEPWYETIEGGDSITQGDLIFNCPLLSWNVNSISFQGYKETETLVGATNAISADVVIMTQACDLEYNKVSNIILCPHISLTEYRTYWEDEMRAGGQNPTVKAWKNHCNDICDGYVWNFSMINKYSIDGETEMEVRLVDFHEVFTIPRKFLEKLLEQRNEKRFRLLPPYREHLSQAFARFFMRVGLPVPIEKEWRT
jgi:hypothetical protein